MDFSFFLLASIVFIAGFIDAIAGGGGLLTLPALLLFGVPAEFVFGTNKLISTLGTIVSTGRYFFSKRIVWKVCAFGAIFSLLGSSFAAGFVSHLPAKDVASFIMLLLPIAGLLVMLPKKKITEEKTLSDRQLLLRTATITFMLGAYDGGFGPGTGTLLVFALFGIVQISLLQAAATARFFNLLSNIGALATFMWLGKVNYSIGLPIALFGIAGHWCGAHTALKRGDQFVRKMLLISSALLFVGLILKYWL